MNKTQLIDEIMASMDLPKAKAMAIVDLILEKISSTLSAGEQVVLAGFGTFSVKKRAARLGRNPRDGSTLQIPEAKVAGFKAAAALKDAVNGKK